MFKNTTIGLDISDHSVEVVKLSRDGGQVNILSRGREILPVGVVKRGEIKDE